MTGRGMPGLASFAAELRRASRGAANAAAEEVRAGAEKMAQAVRAGCPTDTGATKAGIEVESRTSGDFASSVIVVGAGHDQAFIGAAEFGNRKHRASPFIRPAFDGMADDLADHIAGEMADWLSGTLR